MKRILVTGTLGFIFSNFVRIPYGSTYDYEVIGLDKAVKPYHLDSMYRDANYRFYFADLMDQHVLNNIFTIEKPDVVIGGAAESFVDNSITDIMPFLNSNIIGTQNLINMCLKHNVARYLHISTDEVYGHQTDMYGMPWKETDPLQPRNPYSASKACAEHIVIAAHNTHGLQYQMTRSCNVFGPRQKDENLIPMVIKALIHDDEITIHGNGENFRQYIFVNDVVAAFHTILQSGRINTTYNIGDANFYTNLEIVERIARLIGRTPRIRFIPDRKAHDFGYKVDSQKLLDLGWKPNWNFDIAMEKTIDFYVRKFSK